MNEKQVISRLKARMAGRQQDDFARELDVSASFLSEVLRGKRAPTGKVLDALGLDRVVVYRARNGGKT